MQQDNKMKQKDEELALVKRHSATSYESLQDSLDPNAPLVSQVHTHTHTHTHMHMHIHIHIHIHIHTHTQKERRGERESGRGRERERRETKVYGVGAC